jgi:hypothetical protein
MEIYENVTDARSFDEALRAGEALHGLDKLSGAGNMRKTEIFIDDVLEPGFQPNGTACA